MTGRHAALLAVRTCGCAWHQGALSWHAHLDDWLHCMPPEAGWQPGATTQFMCLQGEGDSSFVGSNRFFPFSTVVFASWDFHLTDPSAARNLRRSIRNQLKEMVNDALLADKIIDRKTKIKEFARKVRICGVLPVKDMHSTG